jgi:hypothetical protein
MSVGDRFGEWPLYMGVELWRLYFETGHRRGDFLIDRMTESGRDLPQADLLDS